MFYYLDSLLQKDDLKMSEEFGKLIVDLYCDIAMLQSNGQ